MGAERSKFAKDFAAKLRQHDFGQFVTFLGIASYSIEGIGLLFNLRRDYISERSEPSFRRSYFTIYFLVMLLYVGFGVVNYLHFGSATQPIVFFNYDLSQVYLFSLQATYAVVGLLGAVPVQPAEHVPGLRHRV